MAIAPYIHRCTVRSGNMEGNKNHHEVKPFEVEYQSICYVCGELLATPDQIVAHIYEQLLEN